MTIRTTQAHGRVPAQERESIVSRVVRIEPRDGVASWGKAVTAGTFSDSNAFTIALRFRPLGEINPFDNSVFRLAESTTFHSVWVHRTAGAAGVTVFMGSTVVGSAFRQTVLAGIGADPEWVDLILAGEASGAGSTFVWARSESSPTPVLDEAAWPSGVSFPGSKFTDIGVSDMFGGAGGRPNADFAFLFADFQTFYDPRDGGHERFFPRWGEVSLYPELTRVPELQIGPDFDASDWMSGRNRGSITGLSGTLIKDGAYDSFAIV